MAELLTGVALLALSFLVQVMVWRIALPRRHTPALLVLFAVVPLIAISVAHLIGYPIHFSAAQAQRICNVKECDSQSLCG